MLLGVGDAHWVKCLPQKHEESRCRIDGVPVTLASGRQTHENTEGLPVSQSGLSVCYMIISDVGFSSVCYEYVYYHWLIKNLLWAYGRAE